MSFARPSKKAFDVFAYGLRLLARREYSRSELQRKLEQKGASSEQAQAALSELIESGFQDDQRFACAWARTRCSAGYGPVRISQELSMHGLSTELVNAGLDACEADWLALAQAAVTRRYSAADLAVLATRNKAVNFLLRRGFAIEMAYSAVDLRQKSTD